MVKFPIDVRRPSDLEASFFPLGLVIVYLYEHRSTGGSFHTYRAASRLGGEDTAIPQPCIPDVCLEELYSYRRSGFSRGVTGEMDDHEAKDADCSALRPLALKMAKVYKPCALVVKKTELMEGGGDTHGMRPRRKEDIVDWLIRVLYKLEYYDHGLLTYAGVVTLLKKYE